MAAPDRTAEALPALECDLVMKGGVTSGVIYPSAVAAIAQDYRLRSIGGTSAGAIAAAAAAAMELGRTSRRNPEACEQLGQLATELGAKDGGEPLLARLFEADQDTRALFRLLRKAAERSATSKWGAVAWVLRWPVLMGAGASAVITALLFLAAHQVTAWFIATILLLFLSLAVVGSIVAGILLWFAVYAPALQAASTGGFGFCSGMARAANGSQKPTPSLSEWLHHKFQQLAGLPLSEPLTFGDLWIAEHRVSERTRSEALRAAARSDTANDAVARAPRSVDLALVASDVSRAQSVQFPFVRREDKLYARISDLGRLFATDVVNWLVARQWESALTDVDLGDVPESDLIRLPAAEDLPVLLAVRASLSFPVLFKAVRLYIVRRRPGGTNVLSELWLADGGITSNFPVHLFDAAIPSRPTFCINLLYADDELQPDERAADPSVRKTDGQEGQGLTANAAAPADDLVYMLRTNYGRLAPYTPLSGGGLGGLLRFVMRVVSTARQWNDNQLLDVPGYRDRIVHVRMRPDEGGFNFDMGPEKITDLQERGRRAGYVIAKRFLPTTMMDPLHPKERLKLNWANHRMARFRSFLAGVEVTTSRFVRTWAIDLARAESLPDDPAHAEPSLHDMVERVRPSKPIPKVQPTGYAFRSNAQADLALDMVQALERLAALRSASLGVDFIGRAPTSPRPKQRLALRPAADSDIRTELPS